MRVREKLARRIAETGLSGPEAAFERMEAYFELLRKWNKRVALTSLPVEDATDEAIDRLLIEPALAAAHLPSPTVTLIDIGSGGGSPAIPLKLMTPGITLVMVESRQKKAAFLREAIRHLALTRARVESDRFEDLLKQPGFQESADVITLRAVKVNPGMLALIQGFLKLGGFLFLFSSVTQNNVGATQELKPVAVHPLLPEFGSRLEVLRKIG